MKLVFGNAEISVDSMEGAGAWLEGWHTDLGAVFAEEKGQRHQLLSLDEMESYSLAMGHARWKNVNPPVEGETAAQMGQKLAAELWAKGEAWVIASSVQASTSAEKKIALMTISSF